MFEAGMRQHAVADQDAEPPGVEEGLVYAGNAVDHTGEAEGVVGSAPLFAGERQSGRDRAVDVGELIGLDTSVGDTGAGEDAELVGDLLLEVKTEPAAAVVATDRCDFGGAAGHRGQSDGVGEAAHAAAGKESGDRD